MLGAATFWNSVNTLIVNSTTKEKKQVSFKPQK